MNEDIYKAIDLELVQLEFPDQTWKWDENAKWWYSEDTGTAHAFTRSKTAAMSFIEQYSLCVDATDHDSIEVSSFPRFSLGKSTSVNYEDHVTRGQAIKYAIMTEVIAILKGNKC